MLKGQGVWKSREVLQIQGSLGKSVQPIELEQMEKAVIFVEQAALVSFSCSSGDVG